MFGWNAVTLYPRAHGVNTDAARVGDLRVASGGFHDVGMGSHQAMMPFASVGDKCLLHQECRYASCMVDQEAAARLKAARETYFTSAKSAAEAMGVPVASYIQHENATRGFKRARAEQYARRFRTTPEWLLLGRGSPPTGATEPSADDLEQMIRESLEDVVTVQTRLSDLPRIVAPALHEQLERFRADRAGQGSEGEKPSPGKSSQSRAATKPADPAGSRTA